MREFLEKTYLYLYSDWSRVELSERDDYKHLHIVVKSPVTKNHVNEVINYAKKFDKLSIVIAHSIEDKYDLSFLQHFPQLSHFSLTAHLFKDFEQVKFIPDDIESLRIAATNSLRLSLGFISRFKKLQSLSLEKHTKDIDVLSDVKQLRRLAIRSITMPNLETISGLNNLKSLEIRLGGTKNLSLLPNLTQLEYLELWAINKIENIDAISDTSSLKRIYLDQLKNVKNVSSLKQLAKLKWLGLCRMKGLESLEWVSKAPVLEEFSITETSQLSPEKFLPLVGHPTLRAADIYIGNKYTLPVREMLNLPEIESKWPTSF